MAATTRSNSEALQSAPKGWRIGLWVAQVMLALVYLPAGATKLLAPIAEVAQQMPWAADVAPSFVRFIGAVDLAAGIGILLPAMLRIFPRLTVWAALGSVVLQLCAIMLHTTRGEYSVVPFNLVLIALAVLVAWGRTVKAPIEAR